MKKILIVGLMLVASGSAYSGEKEYTLKDCKNELDANRCDDKCEILGKVSFKTSKSLNSVMENYTISNPYETASEAIENCKIFDENTFSCKNEHKLTINVETLSNGKYFSKSSWKHSDSESFWCGTEIKSIFNLFK